MKTILYGFTFRRPDGSLDYRIVERVEAAQVNAAFACKRPHTFGLLPGDWNRAYKQGFRVVRARLVEGRGAGAWKNYQPNEPEDET